LNRLIETNLVIRGLQRRNRLECMMLIRILGLIILETLGLFVLTLKLELLEIVMLLVTAARPHAR